MTVETTASTQSWDGNGTTGPFPFTLPFTSTSHLYFFRIAEDGTVTAEAGVTIAEVDGGVNGGAATLTSILAVGQRLFMERVVPLTQGSSFRSQDGYQAGSHENAFDYAMMALQQTQAKIDKALHFPNTSLIDAELPDGEGFVAVLDGELVLSAGSDSIISAAMLPVVQATTLAQARTNMGVAALASPTFTGTVTLPAANLNGNIRVNTTKLSINASDGHLGVGAVERTGQGAFQSTTEGVGGGNPVNSGSSDPNQIGCFSAGAGAQLRFVAYLSGAIGILATNLADYSQNYSLVLNPNGGAVLMPSVYGNTTASAANVTIDTNGNLFRSTSSRKYKHDITDYTRGLDDVMMLRPVFYKGNHDGSKQFAGLIAEEVDEAGLTEFVIYSADERDEDDNLIKAGEPDSLAYSNMVTLAFKAIQQLKSENDALKARVTALENP